MPMVESETQKITIIDSIMGTGKSTFMIEKIINGNPKQHFLCVLPSLNECTRYSQSIEATTYEPETRPSKSIDLQRLIAKNRNIVTTHALIQNIDKTTIDLLKESDYTLIIDECLDVVHEYKNKFSKSDVKSILHDGYAYPNEQGFLLWNTEREQEIFGNNYSGRWDDIKRLCDLQALMCLRKKDGSLSNDVLIWNFPVTFFSLFSKCYICTYLWNGSIQKAYFDMHKVAYQHMTLSDGKLITYNPEKELELRHHYFGLINLHEDSPNQKLNEIGIADDTNRHPLSSSWYKGKSSTETGHLYLSRIKKNTENYFKNIAKTKSIENMYTVYEPYRKYVKGEKYTKGFVPCNAKGTNDYCHKVSLAYLINFFPPTNIVHFFNSQGVKISQDLFALSELLQWIWRSRIRERKSINLYLPSQRMRNLLEQWSSGTI